MSRGRALLRPGSWVLLGAAVLAAAVLVESGTLLHSRPDDDPFPHNEHVGLFPTCMGCHAGITTGQESRFYTVTPEQCANCHDGEELETVEWKGPTPRGSNLSFRHPDHADEVAGVGDEALTCQSCHASSGDAPRMAVGVAKAEACLGCHAHEAEEHLAATTDCTTCHLPLAGASEISEHQLAGFPVPATHDDPEFLRAHGEDARSRTESCAVCHARQSCTSCHLNGDRLAPVRALSPDPRATRLAANRPGQWPEPASHDESWYLAHGEEANRDPASCTNCHARPSCTTCHGVATGVVASMPPRREGGPAGAMTDRQRPPGHGRDFLLNHGAAAGASLPRCESCHREESCVECHASLGATDEGSDGVSLPGWPADDGDGGYHPPNFVLRHGAEAFARRTECADCHSTEAFCRSCHQEMGMTREGRLGSASFHDAAPDWLLGHGRAARQNMESCASCHQQTSCLRCHSARSGWRINPHGPGFDPERISDRSAISCAICHVSLPGEGSD